jgi:flagellin
MPIDGNFATSSAINAAQRNNTALTRAVVQLSSGLRVSRAQDDAASLAIGSRLRAEGGALDIASQNAEQGQSLLRTADGGLSQVQGLLERAGQLAVQAGNGALSATERGFLNNEFQQVLSEIDRISSDTQFNGQNLIGGTTGETINVQVGTGSDPNADTLAAQIDPSTTTALGVTGLDISTAGGASAAIDVIRGAIDTVSANRAQVGTSQNRLSAATENALNSIVNTEAARSTLLDLDVARGVSAFANASRRNEAATATIAEANRARGSILNLFA